MIIKTVGAVLLATTMTSSLSAAQATQPTFWFTTWMAPPTNAASNTEFGGLTTRQVLHTSLGGSSIRLRISNAYGTVPLVVGAADIAAPTGPDTIDTKTDTPFTFGGAPSVTIPPGAVAISDPTTFTILQNSNYLVSLFTPSTTGPATTHAISPHQSYYTTGNNVSVAKLPNEVAFVTSTFFISGLDVAGTAGMTGVVTMGDSITDGFGATADTDGSWPNDLSTLLAKNAGNVFAVANDGISSSRLLSDVGPNLTPGGLARFDRDVLGLPGVKMVFVSLGINDFLATMSVSSPSADDVLAGYRQLVARAHEHNILVYAATITPVGPYANTLFEPRRQAVNAALRAGGIFDNVVDFDAAVRDPNAPSKLLAIYDSGDHLHPSSAGYQAMANQIAATAW